MRSPGDIGRCTSSTAVHKPGKMQDTPSKRGNETDPGLVLSRQSALQRVPSRSRTDAQFRAASKERQNFQDCRLFISASAMINVRSGSRLCKNTGYFFCMAGLWVWMIYRGVICGFVDLFGSRGLKGRDLRFRVAIRPDRGANGSRRAPMPRSLLRSAGRCP